MKDVAAFFSDKTSTGYWIAEMAKKYRVILYVIVFVTAAGIIYKLLADGEYYRLLRQSEHMELAKNRKLNKIKQKFEVFYQLNGTINNRNLFIKSAFYKMRIMGVRFYKIRRMPVLFAVFDLLIGGIGWLLFYWKPGERDLSFVSLAEGIFGASILVVACYLSNFEEKQQLLCINIEDYLENIVAQRLQYEYPEGLKEVREKLEEKGKELKEEQQLSFTERRKKKREQKKMIKLQQKEASDKKKILYKKQAPTKAEREKQLLIKAKEEEEESIKAEKKAESLEQNGEKPVEGSAGKENEKVKEEQLFEQLLEELFY